MLLKYERVSGEQFEAVYRGEDADTVMERKPQEEPAAPIQDETADAQEPASSAEPAAD